jgi:hypothetical protein
MSDPLCANCGYEIDAVNEQTEFCDTCQRAYEKGRVSV